MKVSALTCLFAVLAMPAVGQTAKVVSGDHEGFSRLVVELPAADGWQLGRTPDGYALAVQTQPLGYDLSAVFNRIRQDRLAAISVNPENGNLEIGMACACHAIPFEFRPGVIVIDLRDGPPPEGSSFEDPLPESVKTTDALPARAGSKDARDAVLAAPQDNAPLRTSDPQSANGANVAMPKERWTFSEVPSPQPTTNSPAPAQQGGLALDLALRSAAVAVDDTAPSPKDFTPASVPMTTLRDELLVQISRGAARGIVDIPSAEKHGSNGDEKAADVSFPQVAIDPLPGLSAMSDNTSIPLTAEGKPCIEDDKLDFTTWAKPGSVAETMASLSSGIIGEFDAVRPEPLADAVRYALFLGFGAEAAHMLASFPTQDLATDAPVWTALGHLIDGDPDKAGVFDGMQACDSAAAMWSVLGADPQPPVGEINTQAVLRSFSALPIHLRLAIGPRLADRFLEMHRQDVVQSIQDSIARAPEGLGAEADLISAKLSLAKGNYQDAAVLAEGVIENAGPAVPQAMLDLVQSSLAQGKPVDSGTTDALFALLRENQGTTLEGALAKALILAQASNGNAAAAFALAAEHETSLPELWSVLAALGSDDDLLAFAVRASDDPLPEVSRETRLRLAERLLDLGFADAALQWLGPDERANETGALLMARANLLLSDPQTALNSLAGDAGSEGKSLAALGHLQQGDAVAAANIYADLQDTEAFKAALIRARDWPSIAATGDEPWKTAAARVALPAQPLPLPPLAEATALLNDSAETRTAMAALLKAVTIPDATPPAQNP